MRNISIFSIIIAIMALLLAVYATRKAQTLQSTLLAQTDPVSQPEIVTESDYELARAMGFMQVYMAKLWFAGKNENQALAKFYAHEIEETLEEIEDQNIEADGHNISVLSKSMAVPALEQLEEIIKNNDFISFDQAYNNMVNACNSCHSVTDHSFIKIKVPEESMQFNQIFAGQ